MQQLGQIISAACSLKETSTADRISQKKRNEGGEQIS